MNKKVSKIISARARYGRVAPRASEKAHPTKALDKSRKKARTTTSHRFHRNPERVLTDLYNSTPPKARPDLVRKWLREIQAAKMIGGVL